MEATSRIAARRAAVALAAAIGLGMVSSCGDATGPATGPAVVPATPSIAVVSAPIEDTIGAPPTDSLVVRITAAGAPVRDLMVRFTVGDAAAVAAYLSVEGRDFRTLDVRTDWSGRAAVLVGVDPRRAGPSAVRVELPDAGVSDSAVVTTLPGAPASIAPIYTTLVVVGGEIVVVPRPLDRRGNLTEATPTCLTLRGHATVRGACSLAGVSFGLDTLVVSVGGVSTGARIGVVPGGWIAGEDYYRTTVSATNGQIATTVGYTSKWPEWAFGPDSLLVVRSDSTYRPHLWMVDRVGSGRPLAPSLAGTLGEVEPDVSPDGQWIYYVTVGTSSGGELWRVRRDGTGVALLARPEPGVAFHRPSVSPDGRSVAFRAAAVSGVPSDLRVLDIATGQVSRLGVVAYAGPAWSPAGDWIAYVVPTQYTTLYGGVLWLVRPDGSEKRMIRSSVMDVTWSPDGKYLLYGGFSQAYPHSLVIQELASGVAIGTGLSAFHFSWAP